MLRLSLLSQAEEVATFLFNELYFRITAFYHDDTWKTNHVSMSRMKISGES